MSTQDLFRRIHGHADSPANGLHQLWSVRRKDGVQRPRCSTRQRPEWETRKDTQYTREHRMGWVSSASQVVQKHSWQPALSRTHTSSSLISNVFPLASMGDSKVLHAPLTPKRKSESTCHAYPLPPPMPM
jgi:hypothetical protein